MPEARDYANIVFLAFLAIFTVSEVGAIVGLASESWYPILMGAVSAGTSAAGLHYGGTCD